MKIDFSRSNVNDSMLNITSPRKSTFDLYHKHHHSLPIGRFVPVNVQTLMPDSVLSGTIKPEYTLEQVVTPQVGPLRFDTHTVAVSARRINRDWLDIYRNLALGGQYGYLGDLLMSEVNRLMSSVYFTDLTTYRSAPWNTIVDWIHFIGQPFLGEGSILDELSYPCSTYYAPNFVILRTLFSGDTTAIIDPLDLSDRLAELEGDQFFNLFDYIQNDFVFSNSTLVNEMPLRAAYAAWYDALRNWHVEERKNLLDPDDWGKVPLVNDHLTADVFFMLFVPHYRCFGSDPFTTIQTDDVFRHVFAPIMPDAGGTAQNSFSSTGDAADVTDYDSIYQVMVQGISKVFPQGLFRRSSANGVTEVNYLADLQTMKRAGMLERYLARNYYFPDTYEGQMRARYNIDASDLLGCTSRYISGSESFLTGEQQISNVSTSEMEAGTRGDFIYLVTFASIIPIPDYDSLDPHLVENSRADLPFPEFADDTRVQINNSDVIRNLGNGSLIGYVPRYYQYRCQLDSVHGKYLREYRSYLWLRDWYSTYGYNRVKDLISAYEPQDVVSPFTIDAYGLHVHVPLDAFLGTVHEFDPIAYVLFDEYYNGFLANFGSAGDSEAASFLETAANIQLQKDINEQIVLKLRRLISVLLLLLR
ncbi:unnamed protein product [Cylicocyclus nassatus]|uniref:Uncharacterized protein n=1 Tax=Cylicocyclus nassatus TaxID=53992 RepID=A0AA36HHB7_CYLNA|nr:unnamed protein product [Cylicocyclus nassatus]